MDQACMTNASTDNTPNSYIIFPISQFLYHTIMLLLTHTQIVVFCDLLDTMILYGGLLPNSPKCNVFCVCTLKQFLILHVTLCGQEIMTLIIPFHFQTSLAHFQLLQLWGNVIADNFDNGKTHPAQASLSQASQSGVRGHHILVRLRASANLNARIRPQFRTVKVRIEVSRKRRIYLFSTINIVVSGANPRRRPGTDKGPAPNQVPPY
jgi:hypothetical protein